MPKAYAKIFSAAPLRILAVLLFVGLLAGCSGGFSLPSWGGGTPATSTGVVTNDPDSIPNIAWQTQSQRRVLAEQEEAGAPPPQAAPEKPAEGIASLWTPKLIPPAAPAAPGKVTVSLLVPLSGKKADLGQGMLKAAQMALFDIGSADFELIPRDTKSTKEGAAAAAREAVGNGDSLILGPVFAEDLKEVKAVTAPARLPVISFTTDWTLGDGNTYIMGFLPFTQVVRVAKYAQSKGYARLAVYAPQTEYCDVVVRTLQNSGVHVVKVGRYAPNQIDLAALVKDFAETSVNKDAPNQLDFDSLMLPLGSEGLKSLVTFLDVNGVSQEKVKFLGTGLWDDPALAANPNLHGGWFAAPDPRLRADFEKRFEENYGAAPPRLSSLAYDATALAAVLARTPQAGASSPYGSAALTNPRGFAGIDGVFRFRSDGLSERGLAVLEIQSGKLRVVDPAPTAFIAQGS